MIIREAITLTYALITVLIFLFSGAWFDDLWTKHERNCHASNEQLLLNHEEGPLRNCGGQHE